MSSEVAPVTSVLAFVGMVLLTVVLGGMLRAHFLQIVEALILAWTALLCWGLAEEQRDRRREEMASEVESHKLALRSEGYAPNLIAVRLVERLLWGIRHDLMWRIEASPSGRARDVPLDIGRRALDWVGTVAVLAWITPVMLITAILVRLVSPGPVLVRRRVVLGDGRQFDALWFRTTTPCDGSMPRVGWLIRVADLDALPLLFSVIRGDISLIRLLTAGDRTHKHRG